MNVISIGQKIIIPEYWFSRIDNFVDAAWKSHIPYKRTPDQIKLDIRLGKIGEIGYFILMKENGYDISEVNFVNSVTGDGGYDFLCYGKNYRCKNFYLC
jgi:hypothetical protein